jgi:hypothetical protein
MVVVNSYQVQLFEIAWFRGFEDLTASASRPPRTGRRPGDTKDTCWNIGDNDAWHIRSGGVDALASSC